MPLFSCQDSDPQNQLLILWIKYFLKSLLSGPVSAMGVSLVRGCGGKALLSSFRHPPIPPAEGSVSLPFASQPSHLQAA